MSDDFQITVVIPTHKARMDNMMTLRAMRSVQTQQYSPYTITIPVDVYGRGGRDTRIRGIMQVRTEWTALIDSDDTMNPDHLLLLSNHLRETGADYVYPWYTVVGGEDPRPHLFAQPFDPAAPAHHPSTILARTSLLREAARDMKTKEASTGDYVSDDYSLMRACMRLNGRITHLPERTWLWYHHGGNTSSWPHKGDASR